MYPKLVNSAFSDGVEGKASLVELLSKTTLVNPAEVFQYLQAQLFAEPVPLLLNLEYLLRVLRIVFEVDEELIRRFNQVCSFFVAFLNTGVCELLNSL